MKYITFEKNQEIALEATDDANVEDAVHEAIEFVADNGFKSAILFYNFFMFGIEPDSNEKELIRDYYNSDTYNLTKEWKKE